MKGAGELVALMGKYDIIPRYTPLYDPDPNCRAEKSVDMAITIFGLFFTTQACRTGSGTYAVMYWTQIWNRILMASNALSVSDNDGECPFLTYFPAATNNVSNFDIFGAFASVHLTKPRMTEFHRHT
jgi:hypothetical protein